jgi:hypothetical protein
VVEWRTSDLLPVASNPTTFNPISLETLPHFHRYITNIWKI